VANSPKSTEAKERLAAALRENLKRRKAKAREQALKAAGEDGEPAANAAASGSEVLDSSPVGTNRSR
jgi:hypothetical protein